MRTGASRRPTNRRRTQTLTDRHHAPPARTQGAPILATPGRVVDHRRAAADYRISPFNRVAAEAAVSSSGILVGMDGGTVGVADAVLAGISRAAVARAIRV